MQPRDSRPVERAGERDRRDASGTAAERLLDDLYREHRDTVFRVCRRMLGEPADAEDAVQETFLRVRNHVAQLDDNPVRYLIVVARNVCYRELNRRARRHAATPALPALSDDAEKQAVDRAMLDDVWGAMPASSRRLLLRVMAGYSSVEIARSLGTSVTAVTSAVSRARAHARRVARDAGGAVLALLGWRARLRHRWSSGSTASQGGTAVMVGLSLLTAAVLTSNGLARPAPSRVDGGGGATPAAPVAVAAVTHHLAGSEADSTLHLQDSSTAQTSGLPPPAPHASLLPSAAAILGPSQTQVTSITPSPRYRSDHTIAATGALAACGLQTACPVFLLSRDGGASWQQQPAVGLAQPYRVLFAPNYPADPSIFVLTIAGLQRSVDAGRSFVTVVPGAYDVALEPGATEASTRALVVTTAPGWTLTYDDASGLLARGPAWMTSLRPLWLRPTADGDLLVVTRVPLASSATTTQLLWTADRVMRCTAAGVCTTSYTLPRSSTASMLAAAPGGGSFLIYRNDDAVLSSDAGRSFHPVALPLPFVASAALSDAGGMVLTGNGALPQLRPSVLLSNDAARSWSDVTGVLASGPTLGTAALPPGGDVLVALALHDPTGMYGVRCRDVRSQRWGQSC
jgi:RNA polymerase sigma-70 factor (ECF subfamily)